jgi:molybdate transport system substrate-binding protein
VSLGEAQAGFVYRTDVGAAAANVEVVTIPEDVNVVAQYPIAVMSAAPHAALGQAWMDFVLSSEGQALLANAGFLPPAASPP